MQLALGERDLARGIERRDLVALDGAALAAAERARDADDVGRCRPRRDRPSANTRRGRSTAGRDTTPARAFPSGTARRSSRPHEQRALAGHRDEPVIADEHAAQQQIGLGRRRHEPARERRRLIRAVVQHERRARPCGRSSLPRGCRRPCLARTDARPRRRRTRARDPAGSSCSTRSVGARHRRGLRGQRVEIEHDARGGCAEHETDDALRIGISLRPTRDGVELDGAAHLAVLVDGGDGPAFRCSCPRAPRTRRCPRSRRPSPSPHASARRLGRPTPRRRCSRPRAARSRARRELRPERSGRARRGSESSTDHVVVGPAPPPFQ